MRLAATGAFTSPVLDAGCGPGENALHLASLGAEVVGVDIAEAAIAIARERARARGLDVEFALADAFHLDRLQRTFHSVLDCGLFHAFDRPEQARYASSLATVVAPGGRAHILCFSDQGPTLGPHPLPQESITAVFSPARGWKVVSILPDHIETRLDPTPYPAWLATLHRL